MANIIFFLATKHFLWKNKFSLIIPYRFAVHWKTTGNYEKTYCTKTLSIKTTKEMKFKPDKSLWEREGGSAPLLPHEPNIKVILVKTLHWFIGERRESAVLWIFKFLEWEDERKKKINRSFQQPLSASHFKVGFIRLFQKLVVSWVKILPTKKLPLKDNKQNIFWTNFYP